jgi:hypothetical protein
MVYDDEDIKEAKQLQRRIEELFDAKLTSDPNSDNALHAYNYLYAMSEKSQIVYAKTINVLWWRYYTYWLVLLEDASAGKSFLKPLIIEAYNDIETAFLLCRAFRIKAACSTLRNALEIIVKCFYMLELTDSKASDLMDKWIGGHSPPFRSSLVNLGSILDSDIADSNGRKLLPRTNEEYSTCSIGRLYIELCDMTHSNPTVAEDQILQADYLNKLAKGMPKSLDLNRLTLQYATVLMSYHYPKSVPNAYDIMHTTSDLVRVTTDGFIWGGTIRGLHGYILDKQMLLQILSSIENRVDDWSDRQKYLLGEVYLHAGAYAEAKVWYEAYDGSASAEQNPVHSLRLLLVSKAIGDEHCVEKWLAASEPSMRNPIVGREEYWSELKRFGVDETLVDEVRTILREHGE